MPQHPSEITNYISETHHAADCVIPGAGAFEIAAYEALQKVKLTVPGRARLGIQARRRSPDQATPTPSQAYADALLIIPKVLAQNAGFDAQDTIVKLQQAHQATGEFVGVDLSTGEAIIPAEEGILDNYRVKRHIVHSWCGYLGDVRLAHDAAARSLPATCCWWTR